MSSPSGPPAIFDRTLRALRRDRATRTGRADFVRGHIAAELLDRLAIVTRQFADALEIGSADDALAGDLAARGIKLARSDAGALNAARAGGMRADEDALPFAPESFDLILSAGGLDQVDDLPGALIQIRGLLRPDGLFLGGFVGAGSLPVLRQALAGAEAAGGRGASPRIHPQIDVRAAGDLMQRAGFALPVVDGETLDVRYGSLGGLVADIRAAGAQNLLLSRDRRPLTRMEAAAAHAAFAARADADGRTTERLALVYLLGWAPAESQPRPARRGSATASLTQALKGRQP